MSFYEYKGYMGSAEVDTTSGVLVGKLLFLSDSIAYSATTPAALEAAFHEAVDEYLATCKEHRDEPELPCKGSFNVRVDPDLHRRAALEARRRQIKLNQFVGQALEAACGGKAEHHTHVTLHVDQASATRIATAGNVGTSETVYGHTTH